MKTAYKFRAYPSKKQKEILNKQTYLSKEIYNILLEKSKSYYKETKKTLTQYRMNVWLTQIKKERPEFDEIYSQVLQNVSKRIADAYKLFFRHSGNHASRDIARPQLQEAEVNESGTIFGV
jgi:putative transposase